MGLTLAGLDRLDPANYLAACPWVDVPHRPHPAQRTPLLPSGPAPGSRGVYASEVTVQGSDINTTETKNPSLDLPALGLPW